eukprot:6386404-Pyramimonas_sp.AAC.1
MVGQGTLLGIQESHGTPAHIDNMIHRLRLPVRAFQSLLPLDPHPAGGVITLVPDFKTAGAEHPPLVRDIPLVRGRALNVRLESSNGARIYHYNIHNFGLSSGQRDSIIETISRDLEAALEDPERILVI